MDYIKFEYIPCDVIVKEIYPLKIVSHFIIIRALARQADPSFQDFPPVEFLISPSSPERKVRTDVKKLRSKLLDHYDLKIKLDIFFFFSKFSNGSMSHIYN